MANIRPEKQAAVAGLKEQLSSAKGAVLTGYRGLTVAQDMNFVLNFVKQVLLIML